MNQYRRAGLGAALLLTACVMVWPLDVDAASMMYWTEYGADTSEGHAIRRANLDGTGDCIQFVNTGE